LGDENPWRCGDGSFSTHRDAHKWAREIRMAGAPQSSKRSGFPECFSRLTVTGYGLYYAGGEMLRAWTSWIHLGIGLALPILLLVHIFLGRRTRRSNQSRTRARLGSPGEEDQHPKSVSTRPNTALNQGVR